MQFSNSFWATLQRFQMNNHAIEQIISREDATLSEILSEDSVVQEMRHQNPKLLDL